MIIRQRITIISRSRPNPDINEELIWLCESLGLFSARDRDRSLYRLFVELLKHSKNRIALSSDQLAYATSLSRGTVVHHLNKLREAGIVVSDKNRYILRVENLEQLMEEIEQDALRIFSNMKKVAKAIDNELGIGN